MIRIFLVEEFLRGMLGYSSENDSDDDFIRTSPTPTTVGRLRFQCLQRSYFRNNFSVNWHSRHSALDEMEVHALTHKPSPQQDVAEGSPGHDKFCLGHSLKNASSDGK